MKTDLKIISEMLTACGREYMVNQVEFEGYEILCPSEFPQIYTTGICFSFDRNEKLQYLYPFEPDGDEEFVQVE